MRLEFAKKHKSIVSFPTTVLDTDFVVITGINGAGKSHLLEAIENGSLRVEGVAAGNNNIRRFHHSDMEPKNTQAVNPTQLWARRAQLWEEIGPEVKRQQETIREKLANEGIAGEHLDDLVAVANWSPVDIESVVEDPTIAHNIHAKLTKWITEANTKVCLLWVQNAARNSIIQAVSQSWGHVFTLTEESFDEHLPLDWEPTSVFQQSFAPLFATYHRRREENKITRFYAKEEGKDIPWLDDESFIAKFGNPPWETVDHILETANLPIRVNYPTKAYDQPFKLKLLHTEFDCEVNYSDLSAGEKIIISLAHCLFYAQSENSSLSLPKLLLLDEPDAPLHPAMAKSFMEVIQRVFIQRCGVKVIMTTHSPSTIAFAADGIIYALDRSPRQLLPSSRESAISILTDGFATLMPSTRFVIVEAGFDQYTYQSLFDTVSRDDNWPGGRPLVFVRASDQDNQAGGGSGQVTNWAKKLTDSGLTFFRGILDRDVDNVATDVVFVLGRYSIENYLLDPIAIYACFVEKDWHKNVIQLDELRECNVHLLSNLSNETLQEIADAIFSRVESFRADLATEGRFEICYRNGRKISAPIWLRDTRGHDLSTIVRNCFKNDGRPMFSKDLSELTLMMNAKLPGFIAADLEDLFAQVAS